MRTCKFLLGLVVAVSFQNASAEGHFPVVSRGMQRERDLDRQAILQAELKDEQAALAKARHDYVGNSDDTKADTVRRHEENISALRRELGRATKRSGTAGIRQSATVAAFIETHVQNESVASAKSVGSRSQSTTPWVIFAGSADASTHPPEPNAPATATTSKVDRLQKKTIDKSFARIGVAEADAQGVESIQDKSNDLAFVQIVND